MLFISISLFVASAAAAATRPKVLSYNWQLSGETTSTTSINGKGSFWGIDSNKNPFYCQSYQRDHKKCDPSDTKYQFSMISHNTGGKTCGLRTDGTLFCNQKPDSYKNQNTGVANYVTKVDWMEIQGGASWIHVSVTDGSAMWAINKEHEIKFCPSMFHCLKGKESYWKSSPAGLPTAGFKASQISSSEIAGYEPVICALSTALPNGQIYCSSKTIGQKPDEIQTLDVRTWSGWKQLKGSLSEISVNEDGSLWGVKKDKRIYYCSHWTNCLISAETNWVQISGQLSQISSAKGPRWDWVKTDMYGNGTRNEIKPAAGTICGVDIKGKASCASF